MHELSICQALMTQVERIAANNPATRVVSIHLGVGPLAGVEEQLLRNAYPLASVDTAAEGAELLIQSTPVCIRCTTCEKESEVKPNRLLCRHCGDWKTRLISGDELVLIRVELEKSAVAEATALHSCH